MRRVLSGGIRTPPRASCAAAQTPTSGRTFGTAAADYEALRAAAHSLKSSSANVGAMKLHDLCRELELQAHQRQVANSAGQVAMVEQEFIAARTLLRQELSEHKT